MANDLNSLVAQTSSFSSSMNSAAVASGKAAGGVLDLGKAAFNALNPISKIGNAIGGWRQAIGFIGFGGIVHELEKAKNVLGDIEQAAIGVTRSMGPMKDYPMWQAEIVKGATQLGIEYNEYAQAIQAANKHHAALSMSQKEFLGFTKDAARFGEMVGASASEGAAAFGKLVGESKVGMGVIKNVQHEMLALQNAVGLTGHEMIELLNTGLTPIITQLKLLGESDALINRTTAAVTKLSAQFMAAGFEAGKAAGLVQKLMDPERLTENVMLFNQMGININDAIGAMTGGGGADEMIAKMGDKLPELAKKVASMGMAGVQFAKSLGIPYKDLLQMQNMSSAEAQKAMAAQQAEREKQDQFNKQWEQTMSTWKKWAISLSQAFDQIAIAIMDAFGVKNFKDIKELPLAFGRVFVDFLNAIKFKEIVAIAINVLRMFSQGLQKLMEVIKPALDRLFSGERFQMLSNAVNKLGASFGTMFAKIVDKLPALIDGISKMITYITPWVEKIVNFVAENPEGSVITLLLLKFGGYIMPAIGIMVMQLLPQLMKGAGQLLWSAIKGAGSGLLNVGRGIMNFGGIAGTSANAAGGLTTVGGAATAAATTAGIAGAIYGAIRLASNTMNAMEQGHEAGIAIKRGLLDTMSEPGAMAGVGAAIGTAIAPGIGTAIGAAVGAGVGVAVDGINFAFEKTRFAEQGMASSAEDLLAISNKLKESTDSIQDEKLRTVLQDQNKFLEAQSEIGFTWKKLAVGMFTGPIGVPALLAMQSRANAEAKIQREIVARQGGFGALTDAQKAELLKKQGITGFGAMQSAYLTAKGGVGYNMKAVTDPTGAVNELNKQMTGFWNSTLGTLPTRFSNLAKEERVKFANSMNKVEQQMFTPFADFRKNLMEQVSKGLINPEEAKAKLEESDKAIKALNLGLENQIKSIGMKAAGLDGVWSQIGSSINDFSRSAMEWIKQGGPWGDKSFGELMDEKGFQRQAVGQAISQLTTSLSAEQLSALGKGNQAQFASAVQNIINSNPVFAEAYNKDREKADELIKDAFTASMRGNLQLLGRGKKEQEENALAIQQLLGKINTNTSRGADAAEKTAANTTPRRPVRMINLNEVAMRANESGANTLTFSRG